jgi:group I intron endonuclease
VISVIDAESSWPIGDSIMKGDKNRPTVVYKVTNTISGKCYIGVTTANIRRRFSEHWCHAHTKPGNGAFYRALRKYPRDIFTIEELKRCESANEALAEEVRFVKEINPEYNSTRGGEAGNGGRFTPEGLAKISATSRGNTHCLGQIRSEETRKILSKNGKDREHIFKKYTHLGPETQSKRVLCVDNGQIFSSASDAARWVGASKSMVIELCNGDPRRKTVRGKRFVYVESPQCVPTAEPL